MPEEANQTLWAICSLICRVALLGIAIPVLLRHFPNYRLPHRFATDWIIMVAVDALAVLAPLMRNRKLAFVAAAAALGAHYFYRHFVPIGDLAYTGVAIVLVLLPSSRRRTGKEKWRVR